MGKIWLTSDTHFGHDREFLWSPRGYTSTAENNADIIKKWNEEVSPEDNVMLGDNENGMNCLKQLNGDIHIIRGNHDTNTRWDLYNTLPNVTLEGWATMIKYKKMNFYLSHFPTLTANFSDKSIKQCVVNLFGHTHQQTNFYEDRPYMYHVGVDSHNSAPVLLDDIIEEIFTKAKECENYL